MASYRYTRRAEADLLAIGAYTLERWGEDQAFRYLEELEACCQTLAESPLAGRACDEISPGLHRMEVGRHVIFYRRRKRGILVVRILHERMLPERHAIGEDEFAES